MNALTFRTPILQRVASKAGRMYVLPDGRQVPGVTTVLETALNKPALVHWAAAEERKLCLEIAAQTFTSLTGEDGAADFMTADNFRALLTENLGKTKAHYRVMKKAQNIGTEAHAAIEWHIRQRLGQSVGPRPLISEKAELAVMAFEDWAKSVRFQPLATEIILFDPWTGYAGTADWVARVNGMLTLGDQKTGKAIYRESAYLQNAAYISALRKQCRLGDEPIQGCIVRLPKELEDVTETPFEARLIPESEQYPNFKAFQAALALFRWVHGLPHSPNPTQPVQQRRSETPAQPPTKPWLRKAPPRSPVPTGR